MKNIIFILAFSFGFIGPAQQTIDKSIGEFSTVKVYDLITLKMIKSSENKVSISGKNRNDVEIVNKNGLLKIRMKLEELYDGNDTVVLLYYTSVDTIDANEGAKVTVNEPVQQYEIELKTQEGAQITADIKTTYAKFRAVTGGTITVKGTSKNQTIDIYTGGKFNGKELVTEKTEVHINAAGTAIINSTNYVEAKVKVGGTVYIYGNPKQIEESTVLGGTIKRM